MKSKTLQIEAISWCLKEIVRAYSQWSSSHVKVTRIPKQPKPVLSE